VLVGVAVFQAVRLSPVLHFSDCAGSRECGVALPENEHEEKEGRQANDAVGFKRRFEPEAKTAEVW